MATYVCVGASILWIKRGTAPAIGKWALLGGYMERNETPEAAASRELVEETGVIVPAYEMTLVSVSSILHMAQTHLVFRCHLDDRPTTTITEEASECAWFDDVDLPVDNLAFASIEPLLRHCKTALHSKVVCGVIRWRGSVDDGGFNRSVQCIKHTDF